MYTVALVTGLVHGKSVSWITWWSPCEALLWVCWHNWTSCTCWFWWVTLLHPMPWLCVVSEIMDEMLSDSLRTDFSASSQASASSSVSNSSKLVRSSVAGVCPSLSPNPATGPNFDLFVDMPLLIRLHPQNSSRPIVTLSLAKLGNLTLPPKSWIERDDGRRTLDIEESLVLCGFADWVSDLFRPFAWEEEGVETNGNLGCETESFEHTRLLAGLAFGRRWYSLRKLIIIIPRTLRIVDSVLESSRDDPNCRACIRLLLWVSIRM